MPTDGEEASFEVGIKLGAMFHQFIGTPVSPASAPSLETAIEESIENQPHCESVSVAIDQAALESEIGSYGYTGLAGRHLTVEVVVVHEGRRATASMAMEDGYPLMKLDAVE